MPVQGNLRSAPALTTNKLLPSPQGKAHGITRHMHAAMHRGPAKHRALQGRSRHNPVPTPMRCLALVGLAIFFLAQVCCFAHCNLGNSSGSLGEGPSSCHGTAQANSCHGTTHTTRDDPGQSLPAGTSCVAFKTVLVQAKETLGSTWQPPVAMEPPCIQVTCPPVPQLPASSLTPNHSRDWVFQPEVSLGPALHSTAPPSLL